MFYQRKMLARASSTLAIKLVFKHKHRTAHAFRWYDVPFARIDRFRPGQACYKIWIFFIMHARRTYSVHHVHAITEPLLWQTAEPRTFNVFDSIHKKKNEQKTNKMKMYCISHGSMAYRSCHAPHATAEQTHTHTTVQTSTQLFKT